MKNNENSYENKKERIIESVSGIAKCYILLNYAYNTEDKIKFYLEEFRKSYLNLYRIIKTYDEDITNNHFPEIGIEIRKMLDLDIYTSNMSFLDSVEIGNELEKTSDKIDKDYEVKTICRTVKLNFYHNNNCEFGINTGSHVRPIEYGIIDPIPKTEKEEEFIISSLTNYFKHNFTIKKNKIYMLKDM